MNYFVNKILTTRIVRKVIRPIFWGYLLLKLRKQISYLQKSSSKKAKTDIAKEKIVYLRTDFWIKKEKASGAVAHTKGVVEAFARSGIDVQICSIYPLPYLMPTIPVIQINPNITALSVNELQELEYNHYFINEFLKTIKDKPSIIYQRYGLNNYSGAYLAKKMGVPFVLEYNGSEVWMARHWGRKLRYEKLTQKIELLNFANADLIVGNAESMRNELIGKGVDDAKILIVPNGVDETRFNSQPNTAEIREAMGFDNENVVVTFIGTFGPWHGAEILAKTIKKVIANNNNVRFLFIGDGKNLPLVKQIVYDSGMSAFVRFTGIIPQLETPKYLAASDILVSPQIPNPDGTPFFGSPTKLFEYMATGKAIVASNLDSMGSVLRHDETAILVEPGDVQSLTEGIVRLSNDPELCEYLGENAHREVVEKYTWDIHVKKILGKVKELYSLS